MYEMKSAEKLQLPRYKCIKFATLMSHHNLTERFYLTRLIYW